MPEDNQKGQDEPQAASPEAQGEVKQPEEVSTSKEPAEGQELPQETKERTREQFEKLKKNNAELKKQLDAKEKQQLPSVLDSYLSSDVPEVSQEQLRRYQAQGQVPQPQYQQPYQPQGVPQPQPKPSLVDQDGYVNADVLTKELEAAKQARLQAERATREAREATNRIARFEVDQETQNLYREYPELDPNNGEVFNQEAYELVRDRLASQTFKTGKRNAMKAAKDMSKFFRSPEPKPTPQQEKVLEQRAQINTQSGSSSIGGYQSMSQEELVKASRRDPNAMAARLANWEASNKNK